MQTIMVRGIMACIVAEIAFGIVVERMKAERGIVGTAMFVRTFSIAAAPFLLLFTMLTMLFLPLLLLCAIVAILVSACVPVLFCHRPAHHPATKPKSLPPASGERLRLWFLFPYLVHNLSPQRFPYGNPHTHRAHHHGGDSALCAGDMD